MGFHTREGLPALTTQSPLSEPSSPQHCSGRWGFPAEPGIAVERPYVVTFKEPITMTIGVTIGMAVGETILRRKDGHDCDGLI
jgi:hypothetical protein